MTPVARALLVAGLALPLVGATSVAARSTVESFTELPADFEANPQAQRSVVLDAEGNIRYRHTGYRPGDEKELEKVVVELLGEGGADPADEAGLEHVVGELGDRVVHVPRPIVDAGDEVAVDIHEGRNAQEPSACDEPAAARVLSPGFGR